MLRFALGLILALSVFATDAQAYLVHKGGYVRKHFGGSKWVCALTVRYTGGLPVNQPVNFVSFRIALTVKDDASGVRYRLGESGDQLLQNMGAWATFNIYNLTESDSNLDDYSPEIEVEVFNDDNQTWYSVQHYCVFEDVDRGFPIDYDHTINSCLVNWIDLNQSGSESYITLSVTADSPQYITASKSIRFYMQPVDSNGQQTGNEVFIGSISVDHESIMQKEVTWALSGVGVHTYGHLCGGAIQLRCKYMVFNGTTWDEQNNFQFWVGCN